MGRNLYESYPYVRDLYRIAQKETGINVAALSFGDPSDFDVKATEETVREALDQTRFTQLALATYNASCIYAFGVEKRRIAEFRPRFDLGESYGGFTTLFSGGGFGDLGYKDTFRPYIYAAN